MNEHPTTEDLLALVKGALDPHDEEALFAHIEWCDECLEVYEVLWGRASEDLPKLSEAFLDPATALRLEGRLFRRIHVASLGTSCSWLATEGLLRVLVGVLLPILDYESAPGKRIRGEQP